ncbi:MAG TPA: hypothetical protein PKV33_03820 [Methanothrix sp.]|nr:hypothetical protein [Methanothrix sp.]
MAKVDGPTPPTSDWLSPPSFISPFVNSLFSIMPEILQGDLANSAEFAGAAAIAATDESKRSLPRLLSRRHQLILIIGTHIIIRMREMALQSASSIP